jgi:hypothetical protein
MDGRCYVHGFELAENHCRNCGMQFCSECLVYAFGANKPPYCISCALAASGVRSNAARRPTLSKREIKRMEKERKKADARGGKPTVEVAPAPVAAVVAPEPVMDVDVEADNPFAWADDPNAGQRVPF